MKAYLNKFKIIDIITIYTNYVFYIFDVSIIKTLKLNVLDAVHHSNSKIKCS